MTLGSLLWQIWKVRQSNDGMVLSHLISIVSNIIFSVFVSRGFVYLSNPLIKSLRKAPLSTSSILTEEQSALKNELEIWAENFHKRRLLLRRQLREPGRSIALRTTFIGYNLDLV